MNHKVNVKKNILCLIVLLFSWLKIVPNALAETLPTENSDIRWTFSYLTSSTGTYVFPGSDTTSVSNGGLVFGKNFGSSGKSHLFQPYGLEVQSTGALSDSLNWVVDLRVTPYGVRLTQAASEQKGVDSMLTLGTSMTASLDSDLKWGVIPAVRVRFWNVGAGPFPSRSGQMGLVVGTFVQRTSWQVLFEAGLMAMGLAKSTALGNQRDSSTLRLRLTYLEGIPLFSEKSPIQPWVEFFHTHRTFLGSTLLPSENSLFIDQASLLLGFSIVI